MTIDTTYSIYLLLISQSLLIGAACIALAKFQSRCRDIEKFWESPTGAMLADNEALEIVDDEPSSQADAERSLVEKLALEQRVTDLQRRLDQLVSQESKNLSSGGFEIERSLPIEHALRMVKKGASVESLTKSCGLNMGEARLLQKLHGPNQLQLNQG